MPIGLEAAEAAVYMQLGLSEAELQAWFTGHSHLPWQRMANIKGIGGPLPSASWAAQADLGVQVSSSMMQFGMTPVLPGFAGHVPDGLRRVYPRANISQSSDWGGVGCNYSCDALLEPTDPLFGQLGAALNAEVLKRYGSGVGGSPMFNADTFNEEQPLSGDPAYLAAWNAAVFKAMTDSASAPIYVMQAWAFHSGFWTPERVQAYLSPVPIHSMLILDLNSEGGPVWQNFDGFFGHWWAWCGLIVYGGRRGVYGDLPVLASSVYSARALSPSLVGLGITPEAIDQCSAAFDITLEAAWRPTPIPDVSQWLVGWAERRYPVPCDGGGGGGAVAEAYQILYDAAFHSGGPDLSIYEKRPSLTAVMSSGTNVTGMLAAVRLLLKAASTEGGCNNPASILQNSSTLAYDVIDLTREIAAALHSDLATLTSARFRAPINASAAPPPPAGLAALASLLSTSTRLLGDLDALLGSDANFMLGGWAEAARSRGRESGAESLFVRDALLLVSLWTEDGAAFGGLINDYSSRGGWSGLVGTYYKPRWDIFGEALLAAAAEGESILNTTAFEADLLVFERGWVNDTSRVFPPIPSSSSPTPLAAAAAFLEAWAPQTPPNSSVWAAQANARLVYIPPTPPPSPTPPNWVFLGANVAAVGPDCPFLWQNNSLGSLHAGESACETATPAGCNFINYDAEKDWIVFRQCVDPIKAALSSVPGYSAYAYNSSGSSGMPVAITALLKDPAALALVCSADPLCIGFDTTGLLVEGNWTVQYSAGHTAYLRR